MTTPEGNLGGRRRGDHRTGGGAKSDEEGSETLPLLHGALICVYNGAARRKIQFTTFKCHFLHFGDYSVHKSLPICAKVSFRGNIPDSCSKLAYYWVGNVPMSYYNLNKDKIHMQ